MVRPRTSPEATPILQLLSDYSFDVDTHAAEVMVTAWLQRFEPTWVSQAITEALYQGRYKLVSVEHILQIWQRRGQPLRHFNREFESIILGQSFNQIPVPAKPSPAPLNFTQEPSTHQEKQPQSDPHSVAAPTEGFPWIPVLSPMASVPGSSTTQPGGTQPWEPIAWIPAPADVTSTPEDDETPPPPWPSPRTIPPLTPDQLARLTQQPASAPDGPIPGLPSHRAESPVLPEILNEPLLEVQQPPADDPAPDHAELADGELAQPSTMVAATESSSTPTNPIESEPDSSRVTEAIPNFQPIAPPVGSTPESADTIPPFVPASGPSGLHQRLKAVVEAGLTDN